MFSLLLLVLVICVFSLLYLISLTRVYLLNFSKNQLLVLLILLTFSIDCNLLISAPTLTISFFLLNWDLICSSFSSS